MNKNEFIEEINKIVDLIKKYNLNSKIVLITPWMSLPSDTITIVHGNEKKKLFDEYSFSLKEYYEKNNFTFINPNLYLETILNENSKKKYLIDFIHPNENEGIELYSEAVLITSK